LTYELTYPTEKSIKIQNFSGKPFLQLKMKLLKSYSIIFWETAKTLYFRA